MICVSALIPHQYSRTIHSYPGTTSNTGANLKHYRPTSRTQQGKRLYRSWCCRHGQKKPKLRSPDDADSNFEATACCLSLFLENRLRSARDRWPKLDLCSMVSLCTAARRSHLDTRPNSTKAREDRVLLDGLTLSPRTPPPPHQTCILC